MTDREALARGIERGLEERGYVTLDNKDWAVVLAALRDPAPPEPADDAPLPPDSLPWRLHEMDAFQDALAGLKVRPGELLARLDTLSFAARMIECVGRLPAGSEFAQRVFEAVEQARCPGREGPYGLYDYSAYEGTAPAHQVRDFRCNGVGPVVFASHDAEAARAEFERLTRESIGLAAIRAVLGDQATTSIPSTHAPNVSKEPRLVDTSGPAGGDHAGLIEELRRSAGGYLPSWSRLPRRAADALAARAAENERQAGEITRLVHLAADERRKKGVVQHKLDATSELLAQAKEDLAGAERDVTDMTWQRRRAEDRADAAQAAETEIEAVWTALVPLGVRFLDPPDGGDVPLHEQVRRACAALIAAEARVAVLTEVARPFGSGGDWGKWLAWLVAGAPEREAGRAAAKAIVGMRAKVDAALDTGGGDAG